MLFMQLMVQLVDQGLCLLESFSPGCGDFVKSASPSRNVPQLRFEQPITLHSVEEWIERSGADAIAMMLQLLHHGEPEQEFVLGVDQNVDANQTCKDFPLLS